MGNLWSVKILNNLDRLYIYISPHNHQGFEHCSSNKWLLKLQVSMEYCTSTNEGLLKYRFYRLLNWDGWIEDSG